MLMISLSLRTVIKTPSLSIYQELTLIDLKLVDSLIKFPHHPQYESLLPHFSITHLFQCECHCRIGNDVR